MDYYMIGDELENGGIGFVYYDANLDESCLRQALAGWLHQMNVTFDSMGDVRIKGKDFWGNPNDQFDDTGLFFLWKHWIRPGIHEGNPVWLGVKDLSHQELRNQWDTNGSRYSKQKENYLLSVPNNPASLPKRLFWVPYELDTSESISEYTILADRNEPVLGPYPHPMPKMKRQQRTACYFIALPEDLDRSRLG